MFQAFQDAILTKKDVLHTVISKLATPKLLFILVPFFLVFLIFFRIYNIDLTARFTQDESSDLVRIHQYYVSHKITLVGPISNDNTKVFGSLTYYMLMPFTILGDFEPVSPAYGAAFWGVLTAILLLMITLKTNKKLLPYVALLTLIWYPLLQTSRWAWNPHLVLFWITLGLVLFLRKTTWSYFFAGICLSLAFHNHYIALISTSLFVLITCITWLIKKQFKNPAVFILGYVLPFIPFIIFDLRHPPGLFFNQYLMQGNISNTKVTTFATAMQDISHNAALFSVYITQNTLLAVIVGILLLLILVFDVRYNRKALLFVLPVIGMIIVGAFLDTLQTRYLIPALPFFIVWLISTRKHLGLLFSKLALLVLAIGSLLSFYTQLHTVETPPDTRTISKVNKIIIKTIEENQLENSNIAVLRSPSLDTLGVNLRNSLQIKDINFLATSQYDVSQHLFVLSTSDENALRKDQAYPMQQFKNKPLGGAYPVDGSSWKVYWFKKE